MTSDWLLADEFLAILKSMAADPLNPGFGHFGHTHLYATIDDRIAFRISGDKIDNKNRASMRAKQLGAMRIEETRAGIYLEEFIGIGTAQITGKGLWDYFYANPLVPDPDEKILQARTVWKHASRLFALAAWGHISTTVCGAFRGGVYYTIEAPYMLNPDHVPAPNFPMDPALKALFLPRPKPIEYINLVPFKRIKKGYSPTNWEAAHKMICLSEQRMALHDALEDIKPATIKRAIALASKDVLERPVKTFQYYLESQEAYLVDRDDMLTKAAATPIKPALKSPLMRQQKRERRLIDFGLTALQAVKTEIELLPPDKRPDIPPFSIIGGKVILKA